MSGILAPFPLSRAVFAIDTIEEQQRSLFIIKLLEDTVWGQVLRSSWTWISCPLRSAISGQAMLFGLGTVHST